MEWANQKRRKKKKKKKKERKRTPGFTIVSRFSCREGSLACEKRVSLLRVSCIIMLPKLSLSLLCLMTIASAFHNPFLKHSHHRLSMGPPPDGTPEFLPYLAAAVASIPLSIPLDAGLQNGYERIKSIANTVIEDDEGKVFAYIARPATTAGEKRPVVVLIHQFFGLKPRDTELCDELARLGYVAVAPDCFQGNTTSVIPRAISFVTEAAYNDNWVLPLKDMRRVISYMEREGNADTNNIVVTGFCFGGGLALLYAQTFPENVKGCGVFYGKPVKSLLQLQCDVYGVFGDKDRQFPPKMVDEFESLLTNGGIKNEIRRYPGANLSSYILWILLFLD